MSPISRPLPASAIASLLPCAARSLLVLKGAFYALTGELERKIKETIRSNLTARHVPARVLVVGDIPYTRSGKKVSILLYCIAYPTQS